MKKHLATILIFCITSTLLFSFFSNRKFDINTKRFFYTYPNGLVGNTNSENHQLIGTNILTDNFIPINYKYDESLFKNETPFRKLYNDFGFYFISIICIFISSIYFYIRRGDFYLFLLFFSLATLLFSNFLILAFESYFFLFYFSLYLNGFLVLNLAFRLKGRDVPIRWVIPELSFSLALSYIGYIENYNINLFEKLVLAGFSFLMLSILFCISVLIYDLVKYRNSKEVMIRKSFLSIFLALIVFLPYISFQSKLFINHSYLYYVILTLIMLSPLLFIIGTYKYTTLPEQFYFSSSLVGFGLIFVYGISFFIFFKALNFFQEFFTVQNIEVFYLLMIFFCVYFMINLKLKIKALVKKYTFDNNIKLNKALEEISELISNPISLRRTMRIVLKKITEALEINQIIILVSSEKFPSLEFKQINVLKMAPNSEVWKYLRKEREVLITSSLQFGSGIRDTVYKFLLKMNIQLSFPMYGFEDENTIDAFFLVGEKNKSKSFSLGEIRFIQECARFTDLILHNYQLLLDDILKKKMERNLKAASLIEETISSYKTFEGKFNSTELEFLSLPAAEISGDYIDFIEISKKELAIFLGDVSGHGLGTSYIVSAIKAMIRNQIRSGILMHDIVENINDFLIKRYLGNEFMTLIAGIYNTETGKFEFINAGHMSPIILKLNGKIELANGNNRVLGVIKTSYNIQNLLLEKGDRLILYSDGITETFSLNDEIYGESRLKNFISKSNNYNGKEILEKLQTELDVFRSSKNPLDDTSLIYLKRI